MIGDGQEYDNPTIDENGDPIETIENEDIFVEEEIEPEHDESYYEANELLTDNMTDDTKEEIIVNVDKFEQNKEEALSLLTNILETGEISPEELAEFDRLKERVNEAYNEAVGKGLTDIEKLNAKIEELTKGMVKATPDDILNILTEGGTKTWLYKDEDGNVLVDSTSIPELTILAQKLNLIATDGENESELQLTPEFAKLISDKILIDAKKIELNGSININDGLFLVSTSGNMKVGGTTGFVIEGYERAQLEATSNGTLYSVSKITENLYTKLSEGIVKVISGNQTATLTSSGVNTTSDIRLKENITTVDDRFEKMFLELEAIQYNIKDDRKTVIRRNTGFSAQQVETLMNKYNISYDEFAALNINEENTYSLGYTEFIALNTHMIQKIYKKVERLEDIINEKMNEYEKRIGDLEKENKSLKTKKGD